MSETAPYKFGCIFFDDTLNPESGWYAIAGEEGGYVNNPNELRSDTIWWSNISYEIMYMQSQLGGNTGLRHDKYLVVGPNDCLLEWGYDPNQLDPKWKAEFAAKMFDRIMNLSWNLMRASKPDRRPDHIFSAKELRADFQAVLPRPFFPSGEAALLLKPGQAYADFSGTSIRGQKGAKRIAFRKPRISHAIDMLTIPLPSGDLKFTPGREIHPDEDMRQDVIRKMKQPAMVEAVIKNIDGDVAPVFAFNNSMDKSKRVIRTWVTHPEFITMASFAELEIRNAYIGDKYEMLNTSLPKAILDFFNDKYSFFSWSAGIVAESIWRAYILKDTKRNLTGEERPATSWQGAWIKSNDRVSTFLSAMHMVENNWTVGSYGLGSVYASCFESSVPDMIEDALAIGLVPKLSDIPDNLYAPGAKFPWGGDKKTQITTYLHMTKDRSVLLNFDRLPLVDVNSRDALFKRIVMAKKENKL